MSRIGNEETSKKSSVVAQMRVNFAEVETLRKGEKNTDLISI